MRHFKCRRGISSAIVGAILLTGTTILGVTLVAWSHSIVTTTEYGLASSASSKSNALSEYLTIGNVWFRHHFPTGSSNPQTYINITLYNAGNIGVNVTQIKFNNTSPIFYNVPKALGKIIAGNSTSVQPPITWRNGSSTTIYVTTQRGSIFTTQVTP